MTLGLLVVTSKVDGHVEAVVEEETDLLHDRGDTGHLTQCLKRLLDDPAKAAAMGEARKRRALRLFDGRKSVETLTTRFYEL